MWIGTFYAGLNYLPPDIKHFESTRHSRFVNSVSGNIISSFCEDDEGNIYIGSEDGGVCRYNRAKDMYTVLNPGTGNGADNVHTLSIDGDDLWVGTYSNGIRIYDTRTGCLRRDMSEVKTSAGAPLHTCYTILRDRQGDIWIASANEIMRYNPAGDCYEPVRNLGAWTTDITEDEGGNLWFSTQGRGLYRYSRHNGEWRHYRHQPGAEGSLPYNHVSCIDFDERGVMWVATGNGLARYRLETDDFAEVHVAGANRMMSFVKASGNDLWIGTSNGLVRYTPATGESAQFTVVDGLANNQFGINSVYKDARGTLYVGTTNGYTRFDPARIDRNNVVPPIVFTSLNIAGRHIDVGDPRLPLSLNNIERLKLGPDDNAFSIAFAALSYVNSHNNSYRYKLEGFDKDWMTPDGSNRASYTNLPPGDYTLRVMASNNDKVWNEAGITLPITIAPHWYNSLLSKIIYVIIVLCIVLSVSFFVARRNRRQHIQELQRVETAKEREVYQAKLNFFTTIAHEIRTPVSLILGPLESIMKSRDQFSDSQNDDFDIIHRNTQRLLFLINQLLDFKKIENLALDAQFKACDVTSLIKSVTDRFSPTLTHRGIKFEVNLPREAFSADVDAEALTKLVSNLLNNARKFTRSRVSLSCSVDKTRRIFIIEVADDGVGISAHDISRIFKPFVQVGADESREGGTGLGLSIVNHVVKAHSGHIEVKSQPDKGARFIVELPLHQETVVHPREIEATATTETDIEPLDDRSTAATSNGRPVMLVTDDNPDVLRFLSNYFSNNYTVITATDAAEAFKRLAGNNVDLIVSDWMMPGMSGIEFCRRLREDRDISHIPFILLTAKTDEGSKIEGMNCGADAYIEKPFSIDYLAARISNLLEIRRLLKQKFSTLPLEPIETLAANPVDNKFLSQLTQLIEDNFSNPELSVDFLSQGLGISRSGLYAKVRTLTDTTPNDLIQITRLKRAAQLLSEHRYRINEICYMVGFSNPSYFAKCFQRQFGMKPGEFSV